MNENKSNSRRNFLRNSSLATVASLSIPSLVTSAFAAEPMRKKIGLQKGDVILFQGDSITDAGRKKDDAGVNAASALGSGYAMLAASDLLYKYADKSLKIYNRGISGNKVYQLADRWQKDCLDLKPNVLSILVGVNDFWHTLVNGYKGTIETYRDDFTTLLTRTKQALPDVKLIIGEPYAVSGIKAVDEKWYPAFNDYRTAAKEIAGKFDAAFIPYQSIYDKAQQSAPGVYWTGDGVHPTLAGAHLMAHAWMEAVKG
ncbi:SGNH/GDSL hydrolase family protein [Flavisolibacter ginsenosidimutans]|uniref:SGNH/GDSL hydrolase family protein n=1 Tax=Flavisolibacter ginsenosidimutans TaxID=661481 RepID=A0A5B8UGP1_9BACT|nr:SGNH/GDSL hydrolase family protein [Flavisolibacter ginsenosidimutans]QEC55678.1 SGNH/GDSL hydrolase family protein [Flavisolibacter ginsenosidimutans]